MQATINSPMLYVIIFIVVLVLLIYISYNVYYSPILADNSISGILDLNNTNIAPYTGLTNPTSAKFSVGFSVYIKSWNTTNKKVLFSKSAGFVADPVPLNNTTDFVVYLDSIKPALMCGFTSIQSGVPILPITIMDGLPLQKWVNIVISVDGQIFDAYIDGKLNISHKLEALPQTTQSNMNFGNGTTMTDIQLQNFQYWASSMDPTTVWENYISSDSTGDRNNVAVQISILENNIPSSSFTL